MNPPEGSSDNQQNFQEQSSPPSSFSEQNFDSKNRPMNDYSRYQPYGGYQNQPYQPPQYGQTHYRAANTSPGAPPQNPPPPHHGEIESVCVDVPVKRVEVPVDRVTERVKEVEVPVETRVEVPVPYYVEKVVVERVEVPVPVNPPETTRMQSVRQQAVCPPCPPYPVAPQPPPAPPFQAQGVGTQVVEEKVDNTIWFYFLGAALAFIILLAWLLFL